MTGVSDALLIQDSAITLNAARLQLSGGVRWTGRWVDDSYCTQRNERTRMAEMTTLEEKLGEVLGLAQAAQGATEKVEGLVENNEIVATLKQMRDEAEETEQRCTDLADSRDGKKTAILDKAQETKVEATEMMSTYLGDDADGLDGFEFLTMAEAGEVGHWAVLGKLNESAQEAEVSELVEWALPIQERHFTEVKDGSLKLAAEKDPYEES
jgi:hypothetical protein